MNRDQLILTWLNKKNQVEILKEEENKLRIEIVKNIIDTSRLEKFTRTFDLGKGYKLRATNIVSYKLDETERVIACIDAISNAGRKDISSSLFKWKAELSETIYKQLPLEIKAIVDEILTIKPGIPQLEFVSPEDKT
jgi:hypothetical protein